MTAAAVDRPTVRVTYLEVDGITSRRSDSQVIRPLVQQINDHPPGACGLCLSPTSSWVSWRAGDPIVRFTADGLKIL